MNAPLHLPPWTAPPEIPMGRWVLEERAERQRVLDEAVLSVATGVSGSRGSLRMLWLQSWARYPIHSGQVAYICAEFQRRWSERNGQGEK